MDITIYFRKKGKGRINISDYVKKIIENFPIEFREDYIITILATKDLFQASTGIPLNKERIE